MAGFRLKRIYEKPSKNDGYRILIDRLWPRGIKKKNTEIDEWIKDIGPSHDLRKWFGHKPSRFKEFAGEYLKELESRKGDLERLRKLTETRSICLLYSARDPEHNHAKVLIAKRQNL